MIAGPKGERETGSDYGSGDVAGEDWAARIPQTMSMGELGPWLPMHLEDSYVCQGVHEAIVEFQTSKCTVIQINSNKSDQTDQSIKQGQIESDQIKSNQQAV